jgi:hypothetical protein
MTAQEPGALPHLASAMVFTPGRALYFAMDFVCTAPA